MTVTKKLRGKELYEKLLAEQQKWVDEHGGDLEGYIANYHGKFKHTIESATNIYNADKAALDRLDSMARRYRY